MFATLGVLRSIAQDRVSERDSGAVEKCGERKARREGKCKWCILHQGRRVIIMTIIIINKKVALSQVTQLVH